MINDSDDLSPLDFEGLFPAAVREILRHENPQRFRQWLYQHMSSFITPGHEELMSADGWRSLATVLGVEIWNATPLPGNGFVPEPLPRPGRNDACPCGSRQKFERCCGDAPPFVPLTPQMMWTLVLDELSRDDLAHALRNNQLPKTAIVMHATKQLEDNHPGRAAKLLEPLFARDIDNRYSEEDEFAFEMLLNAYSDLGHRNKKQALLNHIISESKRSPLRAAAWRRLSSLRMDAGDSRAAWQAFQHAQRDQPNAPDLAHLEILLLADDDRIDEIPERARMWIRRLSRQELEDVDELILWLHDVADDPEDTLMTLGIRSSGGEGQRLREWLIGIRERPICAYTVSSTISAEDSPHQPAGAADKQLASTLQSMGVPSAQIASLLDELLDESASMPTDDMPEPTAPVDEAESLFLTTPEKISDVERQWHEVFPCAKPFSTQNESFDDNDPWDTEDDWVAFLDRYPQAYDSVDILDDLATALTLHPMTGERSFNEKMFVPVLERAVSIAEATLADEPTPQLAWVVAANRPFLRAYARLAICKFHSHDTERAVALAERLCALNPHDNHGLRCMLMDEYLTAGRDEDAVALAARFADDMFAETRFGNVLALYRMRKVDAARSALTEAAARLPEVLRFLLPKRIRQPEIQDSPGVVFGGEEQAWLYRQTMRKEWERTPGALDWLKKSSRELS